MADVPHYILPFNIRSAKDIPPNDRADGQTTFKEGFSHEDHVKCYHVDNPGKLHYWPLSYHRNISL